jgi:hypothetical protein
MDVFVAQVTGLCRSRPMAAKWVFVPSHAVGHTLGERPLLGSVPFVNDPDQPVFL